MELDSKIADVVIYMIKLFVPPISIEERLFELEISLPKHGKIRNVQSASLRKIMLLQIHHTSVFGLYCELVMIFGRGI